MTRRTKRALRLAILAALLLVTAGALAFFLELDRMARTAVEEHTTAALNLRTTVGNVSVHALVNRVGFGDFRIASPAGFASPDMLQIPSAVVDVRYSELRSEPVHIKSIVMSHPRLVIESDGITLNVKRMADGIPHPKHPVHLIVDEITVQDAVVVLRNVPGVHGEVDIPVETFTVKDLGTGHPDGILIKDAITQLVMSLANHAADSPKMPAEYAALIKGDIGLVVRIAIPGPMAKVLGLADRNSARQPGRSSAKGGLFGLNGLLGHQGPETRPEQ